VELLLSKHKALSSNSSTENFKKDSRFNNIKSTKAESRERRQIRSVHHFNSTDEKSQIT
jgi:hypothetical protein